MMEPYLSEARMITIQDFAIVGFVCVAGTTLFFSRGLSWLFLPITNVLGLPPTSVLLRTIRPFLLAGVLLSLCFLRVKTSFRNSNKSAEASPCSGSIDILSVLDNGEETFLTVDSLERRGILDIVVLCLYRSLAHSCELLRSVFGVGETSRIAQLFLNDFLGLIVIRALIHVLQSIRRTSLAELKSAVVESFFEFCQRNVGVVKAELEKEEVKLRASLETSLKDPKRNITRVLPRKGRDHKSLITELNNRSKLESKKWEDGRVSGAVYSGETEHTELLNATYNAYSLSNPLHSDIWPSVNQFEAEVSSMTASLVNGGNEEVVGCVTSGGTESIVLAVKAHRELYGRSRGIKRPEIISGVSAHAGIDKACEMLGIRNVKVRCDPNTYKVDPKYVESCINADTIMIYSSAPCFPQGVIDPIEDLSRLAVKYRVGLHVDCCLGGFVLPFAKRMGYDIPKFDFSLPGVTSMSCDTHKYGYASKGTSVILYKNKDLRRAQYFCYAKWTGGLYSTPTIQGSRPGALLACAWASMISLGEEGYNTRVRSIMDTTARIAKAVAAIDGLVLLGKPKAMIVCFGSEKFNIYRVGDAMAKKGWSLNSLQRPACLHMCVTLKTVEHADQFINELRGVVEGILVEGNDVNMDGNAAIYGMAGSMPPGPVNELLKCYTDVVLTP